MEENNNYSHILIIKVWDTISETTTDYGNIESIVKQRFLENTFKFKSIEIKLEKIVLSPLNKAFGLGDIVIDSPFDSDETLLKSIITIIKYIDKELHQTGKLNKNNKIIFKLIKPLVQKNSLPETIQTIN